MHPPLKIWVPYTERVQIPRQSRLVSITPIMLQQCLYPFSCYHDNLHGTHVPCQRAHTLCKSHRLFAQNSLAVSQATLVCLLLPEGMEICQAPAMVSILPPSALLDPFGWLGVPPLCSAIWLDPTCNNQKKKCCLETPMRTESRKPVGYKDPVEINNAHKVEMIIRQVHRMTIF